MTVAHIRCLQVSALRDFLSYVETGQKAATHPSGTVAPVGVSSTTEARRRLQDTTRTPLAGRKRSPGAKTTCASAAAPGAAGVRRRAPPPETKAPARPSPRTADRTTPGETQHPVTLCFHSAASQRRPHVLCFCAPHAGRGTARAARTPTAELGAARAATHPFAKEGETHPASWRPAGSPGNRFPLYIRYLIHSCVWI